VENLFRKGIYYTAHRSDDTAYQVLGMLSHYSYMLPLDGGKTVEDLMLHEKEIRNGEAKLAVLFTCKGDYPSRHFRIMRNRDFELGKFELPKWVPHPNAVPLEGLMRIALRPRKLTEGEIAREPLDTVIRDLHYDARGLPRPASRKASRTHRVKPRSEWTSGYHAKRRLASEGSGDSC
jgi:hypothetical protein